MTRDIEAPEAVLAWDTGVGGASVAVPVDALSPPGAEAIVAIGFDDELGEDGLGFLRLAGGDRLVLTGVSPDSIREVVSLDVVVAFEVERTGGNRHREYRIEVLAAPAAAPSF